MKNTEIFYFYFIRFTIFIKVIYTILVIYSIYVSKFEASNIKKINQLDYFNKRLNILFKGLMAILLIYIFNPIFNKKDNMIIDFQTRLFLFTFGILIFLTADWEGIIKNVPKSFQLIQEIAGDFNIIQNSKP